MAPPLFLTIAKRLQFIAKRDDTLAVAHSVRHVGDILYEARRFQEAEVCYDEALALYDGESQTPPLDLANAIRSLAVLKDEIGELLAAKILWSRARDLYESVGVGGRSYREYPPSFANFVYDEINGRLFRPPRGIPALR